MMSLHLTPEVETAVRQYALREGVSIETLLSRTFPPVTATTPWGPQNADESTAHVSALLHQWQQEYGLPPRPDGHGHTSIQELVAHWNEEDSRLTPEEVQAEQQLWSQHQTHSARVSF